MPETSFPVTPSEIEYILAHGIGKMLIARYSPQFGEQQGSYLAVAVLNSAFLMAPGNEEAVRFCKQNEGLIEQEAHSICYDHELSDAFSLLYSFMLILLGATNFEQTRALSDRASDLLIELRTPEEICNATDPSVFLAFVRKFALNLIGKQF